MTLNLSGLEVAFLYFKLLLKYLIVSNVVLNFVFWNSLETVAIYYSNIESGDFSAVLRFKLDFLCLFWFRYYVVLYYIWAILSVF
jgi:hypothetical protein